MSRMMDPAYHAARRDENRAWARHCRERAAKASDRNEREFLLAQAADSDRIADAYEESRRTLARIPDTAQAVLTSAELLAAALGAVAPTAEDALDRLPHLVRRACAVIATRRPAFPTEDDSRPVGALDATWERMRREEAA